jgi:hypothetical protein
VHILKHPALIPVHGDALHGCINGVPRRDLLHSGVSETGVAGFELGQEMLNFILECLWVGAGENLVATVLSQRIPIHSAHGRVEVFGFHQATDLVENLCALF